MGRMGSDRSDRFLSDRPGSQISRKSDFGAKPKQKQRTSEKPSLTTLSIVMGFWTQLNCWCARLAHSFGCMYTRTDNRYLHSTFASGLMTGRYYKHCDSAYSSYHLYPEMWPFSKWEFIVGNFDFYESHHIIHSQVMYISNFSRARPPVVMAE